MHKYQIGTALIVLNENNQVLLGKRKNNVRAGNYGLPGGRIEKGEKLLDCAKRELKEETNLEAVEIEFLVAVKEWQLDQDHDFVHFVFLCKKYGGDLKTMEPDKCEDWEWFDLDKVSGRLSVRPRRNGDRFMPLGHSGGKKVARFLMDASLDPDKKRHCVILEDQEKIIWVAPFRSSRETRITEDTLRILQVFFVKR